MYLFPPISYSYFFFLSFFSFLLFGFESLGDDPHIDVFKRGKNHKIQGSELLVFRLANSMLKIFNVICFTFKLRVVFVFQRKFTS